jgi:hypothetical protein
MLFETLAIEGIGQKFPHPLLPQYWFVLYVPHPFPIVGSAFTGGLGSIFVVGSPGKEFITSPVSYPKTNPKSVLFGPDDNPML